MATPAFNLPVDPLTLVDVKVETESNALLGKGSFRKVNCILGVEYTGTSFAAQVFQVDDSVTERTKQSLLRECRIWSAARHPNVALLIGVWYQNGDKSFPAIVTEKIRFSLRSLMESRNEDINIHKKMLILQDVSKGLWYLHSQTPAIVHGGLTPDNIILGCTQCFERSCTKAKITNVGVAKVIQPDKCSKLDFSPPEAINDNFQYLPSFDTFCFGRIFWYTVANEKFPAECDQLNIMDKLQKYLNKPLIGDRINLQSLLKSCGNEIPDERPSIAEVSRAIKDVIHNIHSSEVSQSKD